MGNKALTRRLENAEKIGVLNLADRNLTKFMPGMANLGGTLRVLELSDNRFAELPPELGNFVNLKTLLINRNRLGSLPDEIKHLTKLETFSASGNRLTMVPREVAFMRNLKQVDFSFNLINVFPMELVNCKHLDVLDLSVNKLTEIPEGIGQFSFVELNVNCNEISLVSKDISNCPRLKTLRMDNNCLQLSNIPLCILTDSSISLLNVDGNLFNLKDLQELDEYDQYMQRYTAVKVKI